MVWVWTSPESCPTGQPQESDASGGFCRATNGVRAGYTSASVRVRTPRLAFSDFLLLALGQERLLSKVWFVSWAVQ